MIKKVVSEKPMLEMSYFEVNGYPVYYEKIGSGPNPILLIPGEIGRCS